MLEPWAKISERLRRIFKLNHYLENSRHKTCDRYREPSSRKWS